MKYVIYLIFLSTLTKTDDFGTSAFLGLQPHDKAATLVVCWWSKQWNFFSKNLNEIRVKFPEERNVFVLDHQTHQSYDQHARHNVPCKPAIIMSML